MAHPTTGKYSFTGHETFPFRYSWPTKGVRLIRDHSDLFTREDAIVRLGVGKNMVQSIRHWCETLGLIERLDSNGNVWPTPLGWSLLGHGGWDPYLENPGTPWLLHWQLVARRERASTWYLAFTRWNTDTFTKDKLVDWLYRTAQEAGLSSTLASIQRDVDVFIRTYVPAHSRRDIPVEDTFDCPLTELALIRDVEPGNYRFVRGYKATLPDSVFLYALLDYWRKSASGQQTLSFETILHGSGSPGAAFKLSESALADRLERLPDWSGLLYDDTAGLRQVLKRVDVSQPEPLVVLERYYSNGVGEAEIQNTSLVVEDRSAWSAQWVL